MTLAPELMIAIEAGIRSGKSILRQHRPAPAFMGGEDEHIVVSSLGRMSHDIISRTLSVTGLPLLSGLDDPVPYDERSGWQQYWLVDPLDGMDEFLAGKSDCSINIAFIDRHEPVLGVIYAPIQDELFYASKESGAFRVTGAGSTMASTTYLSPVLSGFVEEENKVIRVLVDSNRFDEMSMRYIDELRQDYSGIRVMEKYSSLKFCMIAAGEADMYPCFHETMEWNTAAGHALLNATGRKIVDVHTGKELSYNKQHQFNPFFVVQ